MVATPMLGGSGMIDLPSDLKGNTYNGNHTPDSTNFIVQSNKASEKCVTKRNDRVTPSRVHFQMTVDKSDKDNPPRDHKATSNKLSANRHVFSRSVSMPAESTVCTDDILSQYGDSGEQVNTTTLKASICTQTSVTEDPASVPLLVDQSNNESERKFLTHSREDTVLQIEPKGRLNSSRCCTSKVIILTCIVSLFLICIGVSAGVALYKVSTTSSSKVPKSETHKQDLAKLNDCPTLDAVLNTSAVSKDRIENNVFYTLPFQMVNGSALYTSYIFSKDGRYFEVQRKGLLSIGLTLHLPTFSWTDEDDATMYEAKLCVIYNYNRSHCVEKSLSPKSKDYISIHKKIDIKNTKEMLRFVLKVSNQNMIKESKDYNELQIHPSGSCDAYHKHNGNFERIIH